MIPKLSSTLKARIRLVLVAASLVPLALVARAIYSEHFTEAIARRFLEAWKKLDSDSR